MKNLKDKVYFYEHSYLRDRQIDTVINWDTDSILNPNYFLEKKGDQASNLTSTNKNILSFLKNKLPLLNIKCRPKEAPTDAIIYIWGGLISRGKFIVDLDNPWSLVGYNLRAMPLYKNIIKKILESDRCIEIRCMSNACQSSLHMLFGQIVYRKSIVKYPFIKLSVSNKDIVLSNKCRFLFIATQFEIKGGEALLKAFIQLYENNSKCRLDVITHLPSQFTEMASNCKGIVVHEARFTREEIHKQFMLHSDVLILPTYVDSFGMVALEALSCGLALIVTDVYALGELIKDGMNGVLLKPPLAIWNGYMPSWLYYNLSKVRKCIKKSDTSQFENQLQAAMNSFVVDPLWLIEARKASLHLMHDRFTC